MLLLQLLVVDWWVVIVMVDCWWSPTAQEGNAVAALCSASAAEQPTQ
jgi:hypothetical protein